MIPEGLRPLTDIMTQFRAIIADFDTIRTITFNDQSMLEEFGKTLLDEYDPKPMGDVGGYDFTVVYYPKFIQ